MATTVRTDKRIQFKVKTSGRTQIDHKLTRAKAIVNCNTSKCLR